MNRLPFSLLFLFAACCLVLGGCEVGDEDPDADTGGDTGGDPESTGRSRREIRASCSTFKNWMTPTARCRTSGTRSMTVI